VHPGNASGRPGAIALEKTTIFDQLNKWKTFIMTISSLAAEHLPSKSTSLCWASIQGKV